MGARKRRPRGTYSGPSLVGIKGPLRDRLIARPLKPGERCCGECGETVQRVSGGAWKGCEHVEYDFDADDDLDLLRNYNLSSKRR